MEPTIFKFIPTFSYSLVRIVILVTFCGPASALRCYSNGQEDFLRTEVGNMGLEECTTSGSECFENLAEPSTVNLHVTFRSGCNDCPDWRSFHTYECKKCKTDLCNYQLADKVRKNNRLCFQAHFETELGKNAIYCEGNIEKCFVFSYFSKARYRKVYVANCFDQHPDCLSKKDKCNICNTNLCNIPADSVEEVKPFRERLLRKLEKGWGNSGDPGQNPQANLEKGGSNSADHGKNPAPPALAVQVSHNSSASAKRTVSETLGEPDEDKEDTVKQLISGGKVKNKTMTAEISELAADLDNGSVSIRRVAAGAIDWQLRATASISLLVLAFFKELPALS